MNPIPAIAIVIFFIWLGIDIKKQCRRIITQEKKERDAAPDITEDFYSDDFTNPIIPKNEKGIVRTMHTAADKL